MRAKKIKLAEETLLKFNAVDSRKLIGDDLQKLVENLYEKPEEKYKDKD